jgi:hypothetical protein
MLPSVFFSPVMGRKTLVMQSIQIRRLNTSELAGLLSLHPQTIRNQIAQKRFPVASYLDGGIRYFDVRDVEAYFDKKRPGAGKKVGRPTKLSIIESRY